MVNPPSLRKIAGTAALVLGGCFLLFLLWRLRGNDEHVDAFREICVDVAVTVNAAGKSEICEATRQRFFPKRFPFREITPEVVGAAALPIDPKVRLLAFQNPRIFAALGYCYFLSRGWIEDTDITPASFATGVGGFAILSDELHEYNSWVRTNPGKNCRAKVLSEVGYPVADLAGEFRGAISLIALNPASLVRGKTAVDEVLAEAKLTVNHERIHAFQALCEEFQDWSELEWGALKEPGRKLVREKHPGYAWSNPFIAAREYIAFRYEQKPAEALLFLGDCKL